MDILQKRIFKKDEIVFFTRSSVENPYIYLRFKGLIKEVEFYEDKVYYRIQVTNILEKYENVVKYTNRSRFRVKNSQDGKYIDKYFYTYMFAKDTFNNEFIKQYCQYWFDVHSLYVFDTFENMEDKLALINTHITNRLNEVKNFITSR